MIVVNLQLTGDDLYFHNECQGNQSLIPVCSSPMRNAVEWGSWRLSQENLLFAFLYVLPLGDIIY